uniref:Uncharacterized protein n=1 Tax=Pseudomonas phage PA_L9 TaxID=3232177 RepID=A0AAU8KY17_9CAUD
MDLNIKHVPATCAIVYIPQAPVSFFALYEA